MARIKGENEEMLETDFQFQVDEQFEDYSMQMDERKNSYARNCVPTMEIDKEPDFFTGREKSSTLYSKHNNIEISLDDFQLKKVIG